MGQDRHSHSICPTADCMLVFFSLITDLVLRLETLLHPRGDGSEVAVDLGWWATQNEGNNSGTSHVNVLEA